METEFFINWVGVTMFGLAAIVILGLLLLLFFLALARHRMLALVVLGFVVLFVGLPVIMWTSYRSAGHQRARPVEEIRLQHDQARWMHDQEQWRQYQRAKPSRRVKRAGPDVAHSEIQVHETRVPSDTKVAELTPAERLTSEWPHTMAHDGSGGIQAELDQSTDMESLQTAEEPTGSGEFLAAVEPPAVADVAEAAATPPSSPEEAPRADSPGEEAPAAALAEDFSPATSSPPAADPAAAAQRPAWVLTHPQVVNGQPAEVLVSDPFETGQECDQDIQRRMIAAIQRFADRQGQQIGAPRGLNLPVHSQDLHVVSRQGFVDVIPTSVGPMKQAHRLIVFDDGFRRVLDRRISEAIVGQRLVRTGVFSGGVLLLVGSLFGILKGASRRQAKVAST